MGIGRWVQTTIINILIRLIVMLLPIGQDCLGLLSLVRLVIHMYSVHVYYNVTSQIYCLI